MYTLKKHRYLIFSVATACLLGIAGDIYFFWPELLGRSEFQVNVPETDAEFDAVLNRDLQDYFKTKLSRTDLTVESELLRKGATQVGAAYPKFYSWVTVKDRDGKVLTSGAIRFASVEKNQFEITHFLPADTINNWPYKVRELFPTQLCDGIVARAGLIK